MFRNFPSAKVEKLKKGFLEGHNYQFNVFVELNDAKQTKEAKELLSKSFQGKPIAVGLVLSQVCPNIKIILNNLNSSSNRFVVETYRKRKWKISKEKQRTNQFLK